MAARSAAGKTGSARRSAKRAGAKGGEGGVLIPAAWCSLGAVERRRRRVHTSVPLGPYAGRARARPAGGSAAGQARQGARGGLRYRLQAERLGTSAPSAGAGRLAPSGTAAPHHARLTCDAAADFCPHRSQGRPASVPDVAGRSISGANAEGQPSPQRHGVRACIVGLPTSPPRPQLHSELHSVLARPDASPARPAAVFFAERTDFRTGQ